MLVTTQKKLELLSDADMLLFCEKNIRHHLNGNDEKRLMKANHTYLPDYDESKPSFMWAEKNLQEILDTRDDADEGDFVMVDIRYPRLFDIPRNGISQLILEQFC